MLDNLFVKGLILGFSIAAPVGPVGILCIQRSLNYGLGQGFVSGLGAATADAIYGAIAAFGLTLITNFMVAQTHVLGLMGGLFLGYLGLKTFRKPPADYTQVTKAESLAGAYLSTLILTITNPMTIFFFIFIFGGIGLTETAKSYSAASLVVLGVFTGSSAWWLLLSGGTSFIRGRLDAAKLRWVNKVAGVIIFGFGIFILSDKLF